MVEVSTAEALRVARAYQTDSGFCAVRDLVRARLREARMALEDADPERFLHAQGRVRALRDLLQDLTGQKI